MEKVQPSFLSGSKDLLVTKGNITIHIRNGNLLTTVLFIVVEKFALDVLLVSSFSDKHIRAVLLDEQKVTVCKSTPFANVKQHYVSAIPVFTKHITQCASPNSHLETTGDQSLTIKQ